LQRKRKELIEFVKATGKLTDKNQVLLVKSDGSEETIEADNIIIATGSRPRKLPHIPIDEQTIVTSEGIECFQEFPESMVILGAGVIGCEWATIFSNFGKTRVNIIDKAPRILPFEDEDISYTIEESMEENGVTIHRESKLERMQIVNGKVEYELLYNNGERKVFTVDKALVSVGRIPNIENLGLEDLNIKLNHDGTACDAQTLQIISNIYSVGDITADFALANVAELEGRYAVEKMFGLDPKPI